MDEQLQRLAAKVVKRFAETPANQRLLIAIAGIPGSGKTALATNLTNHLNTLLPPSPSSSSSSTPTPAAVCIPMDGFHLTRAQLSAMPDPITAHARRGAEFTFDGAAFLELVKSLREPVDHKGNGDGDDGVIYAPSFDHKVKDPKERDIRVFPGHRVVVLEGNYLLLNKSPWREAADLVDEKWFVRADPEVARKRLAARHLAAGIVATLEEGDQRALNNDLPNGREIISLLYDFDEIIFSNEDESWAAVQ